MTEEIIIDGVDVSGCIYYRQKWGNDYNCCNIHNNSCHNSSGCYYKQLKRLEQELITEPCDSSALGILREIKAENKFLKQENARLKEENEILKQSAKTLAEGVCKQNEIASNYKQALQEIKELKRYIDD